MLLVVYVIFSIENDALEDIVGLPPEACNPLPKLAEHLHSDGTVVAYTNNIKFFLYNKPIQPMPIQHCSHTKADKSTTEARSHIHFRVQEFVQQH